MGQIKWYKRDPSAALNGMMELDLQERGAYNTILDLIYSRDGDLPDDDRFIAGWLRVDVRVWKRIKATLIDRGKLFIKDGMLRNERADDEVLRALSRVASAKDAGIASARSKRDKFEPKSQQNNHLTPTGAGTGVGTVVSTIHNHNQNNPPTPHDDPSKIPDRKEQGEDKSINRNYAFAGRTVRLNQADLDQWAVTFSGIPDLVAELTAIDAWWQGQDDPRPKNWFLRTSQMLNRKHQAAIADRAKAMDPTAPLDPAGSFLDHQIQKRRQREVWQAEREAVRD